MKNDSVYVTWDRQSVQEKWIAIEVLDFEGELSLGHKKVESTKSLIEISKLIPILSKCNEYTFMVGATDNEYTEKSTRVKKKIWFTGMLIYSKI